MRKLGFAATMASAVALVCAVPVMAEEVEDKKEQEEEKKKAQEVISELADVLTEFRNDQAASKFEGEGGKAEANLLVAAVVREATRHIVADVGSKLSNKTIILLGTENPPSLDNYLITQATLKGFDYRLADLKKYLAKLPEPETPPQGMFIIQNIEDGEAVPTGVVGILESGLKLFASIFDSEETVKNVAPDAVSDEAV